MEFDVSVPDHCLFIYFVPMSIMSFFAVLKYLIHRIFFFKALNLLLKVSLTKFKKKITLNIP